MSAELGTAKSVNRRGAAVAKLESFWLSPNCRRAAPVSLRERR